MDSHKPSPWWAYACLALSMGLVGSYVALSKPLVAALPVFLLAWLRFGIGALAMWRWLKKPSDEPALDQRTRRLLFLESFLGNFLFSICMLFGVSLTTALAAGVIMASIPAVVALLSGLFLREVIPPRTVLAIVLAAAGIALFSLEPAEQHGTTQTPAMTWLGNLLVMAAVVCEAAYVVIGKRLTNLKIGPKRISAIINLWGLVLMTPAGLWWAWRFEFSSLGMAHWTLLVFYALAASVWTVWLWMTGLRWVPASRAGIFTVMLPICAALVGVLFLGERMGGTHLAAFALALSGLVLATLPPTARRATA